MDNPSTPQLLFTSASRKNPSYSPPQMLTKVQRHTKGFAGPILHKTCPERTAHTNAPKGRPQPNLTVLGLDAAWLGTSQGPKPPPPSRGSAQQTAEPSGYNQGPHPRSVPRAAQPSGPQLRSSRSHLADGTGAQEHVARSPHRSPL